MTDSGYFSAPRTPRRQAAKPALRLLVAIGLALVSAFSLAEDDTSLTALVRERLVLMESVAAYKWQHSLPVEDLPREGEVIMHSSRDALAYGITLESSERFFRAQIEAAKAIQHYWIERWRSGEKPPDAVPDLIDHIRPKLLLLGEEIVRAAARGPLPERASFYNKLDMPGLTDHHRAALYDALEGIAFYDNRLAQVLAVGYLRVGTTGDYPPFTEGDSDSGFRGIDVEMAKDLAASLGVRAEFVHTSWPSLSDDLKAGRFDIAMGGVSRTLARQQIGFFSLPYHAGGKTAVTSCENGDRFRTLAEIDRDGVRVIVNPGGTNEAFVDNRLDKATKVLHGDNRTIFQRLLNGDADLMITDLVEARWQSRQHPELCLATDQLFSYQEKAYFMVPDIVLKEYVDAWLSLRIARGQLSPLLSPPG